VTRMPSTMPATRKIIVYFVIMPRPMTAPIGSHKRYQDGEYLRYTVLSSCGHD